MPQAGRAAGFRIPKQQIFPQVGTDMLKNYPLFLLNEFVLSDLYWAPLPDWEGPWAHLAAVRSMSGLIAPGQLHRKLDAEDLKSPGWSIRDIFLIVFWFCLIMIISRKGKNCQSGYFTLLAGETVLL